MLPNTQAKKLQTKREQNRMTMMICHQSEVLETTRTRNQRGKWKRFKLGLSARHEYC
jgi:hypothetical protein